MATVLDNTREAWLAERRNGLGGSDVAKILGVSKWGTGVDVYMDKMGMSEPVAETMAMKLGTALEPFVADEFSKATGKRLIEYRPMIHGNGDRSCLLANLDRIVVEDGQDINEMVMRLEQGDLSCVESILECKTAVKMEDWMDEHGNITVPEYYRTQILHYMGLVPSAKRCYVAVLFTGLHKTFEWVCVERDDALINRLLDAEVEWWNAHIVAKVMPDPETASEVSTLFPRPAEGSKAVADAETESAVERMREAQARYAEAKDALDKVSDEVAVAIGDNEILVAHDGKTVLATYKATRDTIKDVTDWEKVAHDANASAEIIAANTEKGKVVRKGYRKLVIKKAA